jgi:hypothetical protein
MGREHSAVRLLIRSPRAVPASDLVLPVVNRHALSVMLNANAYVLTHGAGL